MAGQKRVFAPNVPAILVLPWRTIKKDVDARHKAGHDERVDNYGNVYPSR
jgi:hypothetical protein